MMLLRVVCLAVLTVWASGQDTDPTEPMLDDQTVMYDLSLYIEVYEATSASSDITSDMTDGDNEVDPSTQVATDGTTAENPARINLGMEKLVSSHTTESPTTMSAVTETTQTPVISDDVYDDLETWLTDLYRNETTGFVSLEINRTANGQRVSSERVDYMVTYLLKELQAGELLSESDVTDDCGATDSPTIGIQGEFCAVAKQLNGWSYDGWVIDKDETETVMSAAIIQVGEDASDTCMGLTDDVICQPEYMCYVNKDDGLVCMEKCEHFQDIQGHCTKDFLTDGQCKLIGEDWDPYPYCDCGSWGAMDDYYDGHQCVSASFIVGMAAGLGALIILILVCIIIWLANDRNKMAKQLGSESDYEDVALSNNEPRKRNTYKSWDVRHTPAYENKAYAAPNSQQKFDDDPTYKDFSTSKTDVGQFNAVPDY